MASFSESLDCYDATVHLATEHRLGGLSGKASVSSAVGCERELTSWVRALAASSLRRKKWKFSSYLAKTSGVMRIVLRLVGPGVSIM